MVYKRDSLTSFRFGGIETIFFLLFCIFLPRPIQCCLSIALAFFSGYDLNVNNLINVNYSTNATCDSAMYVKQILTSRAICQLQIPADCSILNRRSDQLGQKRKKMRFCIHMSIFRSERHRFVGWSARKIEIVKSTIFINSDPIYHQSKVCSSSDQHIMIDQTRPDQTRT